MAGAKFDEGPIKTKNDFKFKDPKEYENLSKEEREELTKKMMGVYKGWANKAPLGK